MLQKKKIIWITCCIIAIVAILAIVIGVVSYKNHKNAQLYTVTFMVDNKVYYQAQTPLNQATQFPTNPTKEGYAFIGWYNEENVAVTEIKEQTSKKITLTAKWEIDVETTNFTFDTESGYTITGLKDDTVTTVYIPDYVTAIGDQAFILNETITKVTFAPNSQCKTIGTYAFQYCSSLQSIVIPKSMEAINIAAFYMCSSLENVTFEPNACLITIGGGAFSDCYALETITIPASVTSIDDGAFAACTSLQNLNFEKQSQLTTIGDGVFVGCNALASMHIPASVTYIGLNYNYTIKEVFYEGTEESAQAVEGLTNFMQSNTTMYYYIETAPTSEGHFWHYVNDKITKW